MEQKEFPANQKHVKIVAVHLRDIVISSLMKRKARKLLVIIVRKCFVPMIFSKTPTFDQTSCQQRRLSACPSYCNCTCFWLWRIPRLSVHSWWKCRVDRRPTIHEFYKPYNQQENWYQLHLWRTFSSYSWRLFPTNVCIQNQSRIRVCPVPHSRGVFSISLQFIKFFIIWERNNNKKPGWCNQVPEKSNWPRSTDNLFST